MENYQEAIQALLSTHVMFSTLPKEDKASLESLFEIIEFEPNDIIAEQFTPVEGMYCVYFGKVQVKQTTEGRRTLVGDFEKDATFGEMSLIRDVNWEYHLNATDERVIFCMLPAAPVHELMAKRPHMADIFKKYIGQIELSHRLKSMLGSATYTPKQLNEILGNFGVKRITKGKPVFQQGDKDPRLYYLEKGTVDLSKDILGEHLILDRCTRGEIIGEWAALEELDAKGVHPYSAVAVTDTTVLVIKQPEVKKILSINPEIHDRLKERALYLTDAEKAESDSLSRAEQFDMRIKLAESVTEEEFLALEKQEDIRKFPIIRQGDESENGAACVAMVTRHYGKNFNLGQIKELANLSTANESPLGIITGAETLGFGAKAYSLTFKDLQDVKLPGIIGWEGYHYAVIYKVTTNKVFLIDPAEGRKILNKKDFITGWTQAEISGLEKEDQGLFIGLDPTMKFLHLEPPKRPILHFVRYLLPYKKFFAEAMLAALLINLLGLASPVFIQSIVDTVVVHKDVSLLNIMLGGMVLVTLFTTITRVVQSLLLAHTTARIDMKLMSEFYRHILSLPMSFFLTRNKGEILTRFGENSKIRAIIAGSTITVILSTLMLVFYFMMMFLYNAQLTYVVIAFIPGYVGLILYFTPRIKAISQQIFLTNSQAQSFLIESLNGIEAIKATANEYMARARWENAFVEMVNSSFRQQKLMLTSQSLYGLLSLSSNVIILWIGANQVIDGSMSIGELMGFNMLVGLVMGPVQQMVQLWNSLQDIRISIDRVGDVLNVKPEEPTVADPERMPAVLERCEGKIEFRQVNFSYMASGKETLVMKDFDLVIEQGQHVAFVGASGCGKSTIAKMVVGFNVPSSGECLIDGKNITQLSLASLRRHIGVVLQDSFLIAGTVAQNIALGDPEPDMQAVKIAARLSGVDGEIMKWPVGYQTLIGEKGMGISGGQRQRICIARALCRNPRILIFDEATSALDNASEKLIQANMRDILKGRTSFTIAHRLSTIIDADMICYIHAGKVSEKGTHEQLTDPAYLKKMGYTGRYYTLAQTQFNLKPLNLDEVE